jgi:hypothetical protein
MNLKEAMAYVKQTVGKDDAFSVYVIKNQMLYSNNQVSTAAAPLDQTMAGVEATIPSGELEAAVARMPTGELSFMKGELLIKQGRLRAAITTRSVDIDPPIVAGEEITVPAEWKAVLKPLSEIVDDKARQIWMSAIMCFQTCTAAVGEFGAFFAVADVSLFGRDLLLPAEAARFFAKVDAPSKLYLEANALSAVFPNRCIYRTQLIAGEAPTIVQQRLIETSATLDVAITEDWREVMLNMATMAGKGDVIIDAEKFRSTHGQLHAEAIIETRIGKPVALPAGVAKRILEFGTSIDFSQNPVRWSGKSLRGLAAIRSA